MAQVIDKIVRSKYPPRDTRVLWFDTTDDSLKSFTSKGWDKILAKEVDNIIKVTYSKLKYLRDNGKLIPGCYYRITDYQCTTSQPNTRSAGHQFDIIVRADSENKLNEEASAIQHEGDKYFANNNLSAWKIWYCIDNDTDRFAWADSTNGKGVIYRMIDEFNNDIYYDFKNIQFARWKLSKPVGYRNDFDYDNWEDNWIKESTPFNSLKNGFFGLNSTNNEFYYIYNNTDFEGYEYKVEYTISGSPTYYYTFGKDTDYSINSSSYSNVIKEYKSSNKIQLNNIVFLNSGCHNNTFDVNCYNNTLGGNSYSNSFGNNCFNNTFSEFVEFDDLEEKEIIIGCTHNIFGNYCYSNSFIGKCNYNNFSNDCYDNNFGNDFYEYNNIGCSYNTFGNGCYENNFDNECYNNTFGNDCYHNILDKHCYSNIFGNNCSNNTFSDYCYDNIFSNYCFYNNFNSSCNYNIFGKYCDNNTLGNNCSYNIFGNDCSYNTFGNDYCYSTFENNCQYIKFASDSSASIKYNYYENNHFGDGCQYILFKGTETASSESKVQNYNFAQGLKGTSSTYLTIDGKRNLAYETKVAKKSNGELKIYCEADLVQ